MRVALGRPDRNPDRIGNLFERKPERVFEHDHLRLLGRNLAQVAGQLLARFGGEQLADGIAFERMFELELFGERLRTTDALARSRVVTRIDDETMQPGGELRVASELADSLAELDQRLLRRVLSIAGVAQLAPRDPLDPRRVTHANRFERPAIAIFRPLDQDRVTEPFVSKSWVRSERTTDSTAIGWPGFHGRTSVEMMAISLAPRQVTPRLTGRFGRPLYLYALRCSSTQDLLPPDAPEGALALAEEQRLGRGRRGRIWQASSGTSLLFSLCLRPRVETALLPSLTPVAAEAIVAAIALVTGAETAVKHPNDVLLAGRKVAGAIAEASLGRVVLGVGVNVSQGAGDLPERPIFPATSLALELGAAPDRVELLVQILQCLESHYERWLTEVGT